jgi:septal ring factor EnvC (AmiA/AmiB activator)
MRARTIALWLVALCAPARAGRPVEALAADRAAAEAEVRDLERRARALDEQSEARRDRLRRRLRALYKLSNGGTLRLLAGAESAAELGARHDAIRRVLARDLDELGTVREEAAEVDREHTQRAEAIARAVELGRAASSSEPPSGLAARAGRLPRPVPGPVVARFGGYREPQLGLELTRRGVELRSQPREPVRAVAAGRVSWVGEAPGLGRAVAVDHGDGYLTLTARLAEATVAVGELVVDGGRLGVADAGTIYFELAQGGTPLDPGHWIAP